MVNLVRTLATVRTQRPFFITTGCVGCWRFDEGTGTLAKDSSGRRNDGTIYGATWVDGKFGKALSFDGVDDYVEVPDSDSLDLTNEITISVWVKVPYTTPTGNNLWHTPVGKEAAFWTEYNENSEILQFACMMAGSPNVIVSVSQKFEANKWYHLVFVNKNGGTKEIYVNGILKKSEPSTYSFDASTFPLRIGIYATQWWNGTIDEVRIYNRALSEEEIKAHFNFFRLLKLRTQPLAR